MSNKFHDLSMGNGRRLLQTFIRFEKLPPASAVANQKLAIYQLVPDHCVKRQQSVQLASVRSPLGKRTDPYRGINKDHQATLRLTRGFSRRRGTSCAPGSLPRRARRRSEAAWRTSASSPKRTVSVSVAAPQARFACWNNSSSIFSVFFIHTILPYKYGN